LILCIAIGNHLLGDDGVAHRALELFGAAEQVRVLSVIQLMPELAAEIAASDAVVFLDADCSIANVSFGVLDDSSSGGTPLTHFLGPSELLAMARGLYSFAGEAFLCRIPATQFEPGERLTPQAEESARSAAELLRTQLSALLSQHRHKSLTG